MSAKINLDAEMPLYPKGLTWVTPICLDDANVIQRIFGRLKAACSDDEDDTSHIEDGVDADVVCWDSDDDELAVDTGVETQITGEFPKAVLDRPHVSMEYLVARFHAFDNGAMVRERVWFGSDNEEEYGSEDSSDDEDLDMGEAEGYEANEDSEEAEVLGKSV